MIVVLLLFLRGLTNCNIIYFACFHNKKCYSIYVVWIGAVIMSLSSGSGSPYILRFLWISYIPTLLLLIILFDGCVEMTIVCLRFTLYSVDTASCKVNLGLDLRYIPDKVFLISGSNQMTSKLLDLSSYSLILLMVTCNADLYCPHKRPYSFSILLLSMYSLETRLYSFSLDFIFYLISSFRKWSMFVLDCHCVDRTFLEDWLHVFAIFIIRYCIVNNLVLERFERNFLMKIFYLHANNTIYFAIFSFPCNIIHQLDTIPIIIYSSSVVVIVVLFISTLLLYVVVWIGISCRCLCSRRFFIFNH